VRVLSELLAAASLPLTASGGDRVVQHLSPDSRDVGPGTLFVAVAGQRHDGHALAADAARAGAVAVVAQRQPDPPVPADVPVILVEDSRVALSALAAAWFGHPSDAMTVAGITGTDGKTTTTTMLWAAWRAAAIHAGQVSTVDFRDGDSVVANTTRLTTMEAIETQRRLAALRDSGCTHVALETSSHALAMHRVDHVAYRLAVYTRITSEHLDVHGDRAGYMAAKRRLLVLAARHPEAVAVLDRDDDFAFPQLSRVEVATRLTYSAAGAAADLVAGEVRAGPGGVSFRARTPWGDAEVSLQLAGRFNVANALAALAAACSSGARLDDAVAGISGLAAVSGRMERIDAGQGFGVVIDYAHTAAALDKVLAELREATSGRLWVVFGSAGERDVEKRAAMGEVAARRADVVVVTDEDPRGEDRERICEQIAAGAESAGARRGDRLHVIPERSEAIAFAVGGAATGDMVLCAGKGHESSIISAAGSVPWSERAAIERALRARLPS
jgi:UDP-N-acetylmuramoyl-L-alanyl-D-glutamate--2,6-diaminopimelate ligase